MRKAEQYLQDLQVIMDQDGNVIMSEGLVLQDAKIWQQFLDRDLIPKNNMWMS